MTANTDMDVYLVGGAVRDELLAYPVVERDWVVVGATPATLLEQGYRQVGKDFPVFLHPDTAEEYALARTERKQGHGYTGFVCNSDPSVTLEQDLSRRDLTVNAMARSSDGTLIDPYGGQQDLSARILRHVSDAFIEDPLRVLRVARFAARYAHLNFTIATDTLALMRQISDSGELQYLPRERIWTETQRALEGPDPRVYFEVLQACSALPSLCGNATISAADLDNLQLISGCTEDSAMRLAALLCELPEDHTKQCLEQLQPPQRHRDLSLSCVELLPIFEAIDSATAAQKLQLLQRCDAFRRPQRLEDLLQVCAWVKNAEPKRQQWLQAFTRCAAINAAELASQGLKGAEIGEQLQRLRLEALHD